MATIDPKLEEFLQRAAARHTNWREEEYPAFAPPGSPDESWRQCRQLAEKYDKGMCDAYRDQIDTLLVFAGLFSAVLTAFTIESYQWLDNSAEDAAVQLLTQIAGSLAVNGNFTSASPPPTSALTGPVAARINIYWFLSLTLSLSAALVGILAKQWIREYETDVGRTPYEAVAIRQMRYEGFERWGVAAIITSVPVLLQAGLFLFLAGMLELLWMLNTRVAVPVTITVAFAVIFYVSTSVLPATQYLLWHHLPSLRNAAQCPYKSPQGLLALKAMVSVVTQFPSRWSVHPGLRYTYAEETVHTFLRTKSFQDFDRAWTLFSDDATSSSLPQYAFRTINWLQKAVYHPELPIWAWHCLWKTCSSCPTPHGHATISCAS